MKKISAKKLFTILTIVLTIALMATTVLGYGNPLDLDGVNPTEPESGDQMREIMNVILGGLQIIGVAVAVIVLVVLAIKYIAAAPSEKADIKKSAFTYVIGAVLLFAGVAILEIIQGLGTSISDTGYY